MIPRRSLLLITCIFCVYASTTFARCPFASLTKSSNSRHLNFDAQNSNSKNDALRGESILQRIALDEESTTPLEGEIPQAHNTSDPLVRMNNRFHDLYGSNGARLRPDPIIVLEGDYLVLRFNNGTREKQQITPMSFHNMKMICHIPLMVFVDFWPPLRKSLPKEVTGAMAFALKKANHFSFPSAESQPVSLPERVIQDMQDLLNNLTEYHSSILSTQRFPNPERFSRQKRIVESTRAFVQPILARSPPTVKLDEFLNFTRTISPDLSSNLDDAAAEQVDMLNEAFLKWNGTYGLQNLIGKSLDKPDPLRHLRIAITTSHMARTQALAAQYLSRFFGVNITRNDRFMTLEQLSTEEQVLDLLDTAQTDLAMGFSFFGDMYRMQEDALCHGAKKALDKIFPESANSTIGCLPQG